MSENTTLPLPILQRALNAFKQAAREQCQIISHIDIFKLFAATLNGALDNNEPIFQPIIDENSDIIAYETLSRPVDKDGKSYKIQGMANAAYEAGKHVEFDRVTCITGLEKAVEQNCLPVTLNISPTSLLEEGFIEEIIDHAATLELTPKDYIFEILEHDVDPKTNIDRLLKLKNEKGCRFMLDDLGLGQKYQNLLDVFTELVEGIKVEGTFVCGYLKQQGFDISENEECKDGLLEILENIYNHYGPDAKTPRLIAESVHTTEEAKKLNELGFRGFQGQELTMEILAMRDTCQVHLHM